MKDFIRVRNQYYIRATSPLADSRTRVLKNGDAFAVFDRYGDIEAMGPGKHGLYCHDTRFLSRFVFQLGKVRPQLLSSTIKEENNLLTADLSNADIIIDGRIAIPYGTLHVFRSKFIWSGACYERVRISNFSLNTVEISFSFYVAADFADIFEVRGMQRERRGQRLKDLVDAEGVVFSYAGLDGVLRRTRITCSPAPKRVSASELAFSVSLEPRGEKSFYVTAACESASARSNPLSYDQAFSALQSESGVWKSRACAIDTANGDLNEWLNRSAADLHMMVTHTPWGAYPYAGLPWFNAPFGRDGIITALESLWMHPWLARGVLEYLAATQAREVLPEADAEPGKILHESRSGEMAALKEVPFGRYYGSVDATPLFVMLAAEYFERTGDKDFIEAIWPNIDLALRWIDDYGDWDRDGFVEYNRRSAKGLEQQGWKDSSDSVFHADGTLVEGPVALCEVQAYVYAAKRGAAKLALRLGDAKRAERLRDQAQHLQEQFERAFWCDDLGTYALALDGKKQPCRVRTSNAGHCLFTGIAGREHAGRLAQTLFSAELFSGWGIRTLASSELRYNPMSYHNGSIWPHDNALIALGLARYGFKELALNIAAGLFEISRSMDLHRLPELFCGFDRRPGEGPTLYPVACSPQSWAVASVFLLVQACLGISVSPLESPEARFDQPLLPKAIEYLDVKGLTIGEASVDFSIRQKGDGISLEIERQSGRIQLAVKS